MSRRVLVVDDERNIRLMLEQMLGLAGFEVECVDEGEKALVRCAEGDVDAVLLDVKMSGMDGLTALRHLREAHPELVIVMMSGHGTIETAVKAVREGASDFLEKPLGRDKTLITLENALSRRDLEAENRRLRAKALKEEMIGESAAMQALREKIAQIAPTEARVLISGERGTGKELIARAIHRSSRRNKGPFLAVNCAAVPAELIESELFGHVKGAFTGATAARAGVFEESHAGTLFLDEIGDMPLAMQAKLLRVLESGEISRVGTSRTRAVDVRVLAATHRDLKSAAEEGAFRADLFDRINVVPLHAPPLRDRLEDIPLLAEHFLAKEVERQKLPPRHFAADAPKVLGRYDWPGNVRELRNTVERLAILSPSERVEAEYVRTELPVADGDAGEQSLKSMVEEAERRAIASALRGSGGNVSEAARRLGLERSHLYKKARALGMDLSGD